MELQYLNSTDFTGTIGGVPIACHISTDFQSAFKVAQIRTKDSSFAVNDYGARVGTISISGITTSSVDYYRLLNFHQNRVKAFVNIEGPNFGDPQIQGTAVMNTITQVSQAGSIIKFTAALMFDEDYQLKPRSVAFTQTITLAFQDGDIYTGTKFIDTTPL